MMKMNPLISIKKINPEKETRNKGFSLIEAVVGIALMGIAALGLAQLFTYSILVNSRADEISNATFLAQQQIDSLRGLTASELNLLTSNKSDELIDANNDGTYDYRRITEVQLVIDRWEVTVIVFPGENPEKGADELFQNPSQYHAMANMSTVISR
ncbi:MAG: prepilin-type N-terminal cleavage/methylation domain-containing protein [Candidatus Aminicenantes bacterium]|nr:prepilin-type N-terminal cleavage/methylation domain-containing protein [Candidatus Aminicenantes bacterium]